MIPSTKKVIKNNVSNRILPIAQSVLKGLEPEPKISDFNIIKELGSGTYGRVFLAEHKLTLAKYAIKTIDKRIHTNEKGQAYFKREIEIMYRVHHPNVVKLFGHFEDENFCYFIMEYIEEGNIYSVAPQNSHKLSLKQIASIIKDVISAVYFLHHMQPKIIHRDIKPQNVLLNKELSAKLTDFGWSNYYRQGEHKRLTMCGTLSYFAPEIINKEGHDEHVDIWCIGVLLFDLIAGYHPFKGYDMQSIRKNINKLKIKWPKGMDRDASDLIYKILKYSPEERLSLRQILHHPFFTKFFPEAASCLVRPNKDISYRIYLISRDNPLTWSPIFTSGDDLDIELKPNDYSEPNSTALNEYNYNIKDNYNSQKKEFNKFGNSDYNNNDLYGLTEKKQKKNKCLDKTHSAYNYKNYKFNSEMKNNYNHLITDNFGSKLKLNLFETHFKNPNKNAYYFDKNNNNIDAYNMNLNFLKSDMENYSQNNPDRYINNEIIKWEEKERKKREKEKQQINALLNNYQQI